MNVCVILTCFNRKDKTINCVKSLVTKNPDVHFEFIITDDNSSDGTADALKRLPYKIDILHGDGKLFWCGGMRRGIDYFFCIENNSYDYVLLVNDDVEFFENAISKLIAQNNVREDTVMVGATCDRNGKITYGLQKQLHRLCENTNQLQDVSGEEVEGDTFNANCVLIPVNILINVGNMDKYYTHGLGDFDLGYRMKRMGYHIVSSYEYVGICEKNEVEKTWINNSLPRLERIKMKESPKGSPFKEIFHFYRVNYGLKYAVIRSTFPYFKILLGK